MQRLMVFIYLGRWSNARVPQMPLEMKQVALAIDFPKQFTMLGGTGVGHGCDAEATYLLHCIQRLLKFLLSAPAAADIAECPREKPYRHRKTSDQPSPITTAHRDSLLSRILRLG